MEKVTFGCFGKLPLHSDFIRLRTAGGEVDALDRWFQEGIVAAQARLGRGWEGDFQKADPWNFVFRPRGGTGFLIGRVVPSRDRGGRRYPFFFFLRIERRHFSQTIGLAPTVYEGFLFEASNLLQKDRSGVGLREFLQEIEGARMPIPEDSEQDASREAYLRSLTTQTAGEFWTTLYSEFEDPRKYLLDQNILATLGPLRRSPSIPFSLGLKFPLNPQGQKPHFEIPFWFDLMGRVLRRTPDDGVFFWNGQPSNGSPCMIAFLNDPSPKSFLFLIRPDLDGESWFDLAPQTSAALDAIKGKTGEDRRKILENAEFPLAAFLDAIGTME